MKNDVEQIMDKRYLVVDNLEIMFLRNIFVPKKILIVLIIKLIKQGGDAQALIKIIKILTC